MAIFSKRRFSLTSPAVKASRRVMDQRTERQQRRSVDSNATATTLAEIPAVEVETYLPAPAARWSTANRVG
ncbi:hypothetical protein B0T10DRAFT_565535 [Thelonectria olida]|uniref:Uncharacterized protein n=1 Tax=Thelonectria olida TaxID=1576542 RepID=A0A9P8VXG0_9HYPO|nr:hypothetical protein B0T10DRAFT_565535 [Thelonectria olida]